MKCPDDARMSHYSNCPHIIFSSVFLVIPCRYLPDTHQVSQENEYKWFFCCSTLHRVMLLEHDIPKISVPKLRLGVGRALMSGMPHSVRITLHAKHRHYFFLCIFRSLPPWICHVWLPSDFPLSYEILWNLKGLIQLVLSLLNWAFWISKDPILRLVTSIKQGKIQLL